MDFQNSSFLADKRVKRNSVTLFRNIYSVFFFMESKVFLHLTQLKLPQINQTYLKIFVWLQHLIKIRLEYYEKQYF